jgi:hypothetical protein
MRLVPKSIALREADYWIFPIAIVAILLVAFALYASVLVFRLPSAILGAAGLWFTTYKIKRGYNNTHALAHLVISLFISFLLFAGFYSLTN